MASRMCPDFMVDGWDGKKGGGKDERCWKFLRITAADDGLSSEREGGSKSGCHSPSLFSYRAVAV